MRFLSFYNDLNNLDKPSLPCFVYLRMKMILTMTVIVKNIPPATAPPAINGKLLLDSVRKHVKIKLSWQYYLSRWLMWHHFKKKQGLKHLLILIASWYNTVQLILQLLVTYLNLHLFLLNISVIFKRIIGALIFQITCTIIWCYY